MEAQRPAWSEEDLSYQNAQEREVVPHPESEEPQPIAVEESGVIADGIKLQAGSRYLEKASGAAETEQITERQLELRHEVQDGPGGQNAVSVGSIIADLPAKQPKLSKVINSITEPVVLSTPTATTPAQNDDTDYNLSQSQHSLYKQAVQIGFAAGLCAVTLFTLMRIIF